jgi:stringent starvation protein B
MAPTARLPPKKDVALALLEQASMYIHLDPRADAVKVPAWFKKQAQLVLQVGLNMAVPIPDLHVDEQGLSCTLSFNRSPFLCMIPWPAVFALVGEKGQAMVWAEDVPAEVAAQAQAQKAPEKQRAHLRSVGEGESAPTPAAKVEAAKAAERKPALKTTPAAKPSSAQSEASKRAVKAAPKAKGATKAPAVKPAPPKATRAAAAKKAPAIAEPMAKPEPRTRAPASPAKKSAQSTPRASGTTTEVGKPKRELPPYLRVVK